MKILLTLLFTLILMVGTTFASTTPTFANHAMVPCNYPTGISTLTGRTFTLGGGPLSMVYLTLQKDDGTICETVVSSSFGYYTFQPVFTQSYILTASKKGYNNVTKFVDLSGDVNLDIYMTRVTN